MEKDLSLTYESLPSKITDWLESDQIFGIFNEIEQKYNLDWKKRADLNVVFLRLITQDLPPQELIANLQKSLKIGTDEAKEIIKVIDEKILQPINEDLLAIGIDRNLIYYTAPATLEEAPPPAPITAPVAPPVEITQPEMPTTPFILHQEKEVAPVVEAQDIKPSFVYKPPLTEKATIPTAPPKVEIERIVHYSMFHTPFNQAQLRYHKPVRLPRSKWFV